MFFFFSRHFLVGDCVLRAPFSSICPAGKPSPRHFLNSQWCTLETRTDFFETTGSGNIGFVGIERGGKDDMYILFHRQAALIFSSENVKFSFLNHNLA